MDYYIIIKIIECCEKIKKIINLIFAAFISPKEAWGNRAQISRTLWVIIFSIGSCYVLFNVLTKSKVTALNGKIDSLNIEIAHKHQSISDISYEKYVERYINNCCIDGGSGTFMTWVRIGKNKGEYRYKLFFKKAKGYYPEKNPQPFDLESCNKLYIDPNLYVDERTLSYIRNLDEKEVYLMTLDFADQNGYQIVSDIFRRQYLPVKKFKFCVVKDMGDVIWFYTVARIDNNLDDMKYDTWIKNLARNNQAQIDGIFIPTID